MVKKDLVCRIAEMLREAGIKKKVQFPKQTFHITDDEGNRKDFSVRKTDKEVPLTHDDVKAVVDAMFDAILESIQNGEEVTIKGFGTFGYHFRKGRTIGGFDGELHTMKNHYCPKFWYGKDYSKSVDLFQLTQEDEHGNLPEPADRSNGRPSRKKAVGS